MAIDDRDCALQCVRGRCGISRHGLTLAAGIVKAVGGAGIARNVDLAAGGDGTLRDHLASLRRDFVVVRSERFDYRVKREWCMIRKIGDRFSEEIVPRKER